MRFGLIGYGLWGRHHAQAIAKAPGATLAAIACRTEATATAARRDFPDVAVHLDYRDLLDRRDVDAVDVVVPNDLHAEIGVAALERGKDVLLEKPLAPTLEDCDRLIAAARQSGRILTVGHELRLSTQWGRIKAVIDAGDIGEPMCAVVNLFRFPYRPGADLWRYQSERVGSWILEELVHHFDFLMWYFERWGDPVSISAVGNSREGRAPDMSDNLVAILRYDGPLYAVLTQTVAGFEYHLGVEIVGRDGAIRSWWSGAIDRTREPTCGADAPPPRSRRAGDHPGRCVRGAIRAGGATSPGRDGLRGTATHRLRGRSAQAHRRLRGNRALAARRARR